MSTSLIFADFNNRDQDGYLRLNTTGTFEDLDRLSIILEDGLRLRVSDGDLTADIVVRRPAYEGVWRGQILAGPFELPAALH